jgi:hypothetical protein
MIPIQIAHYPPIYLSEDEVSTILHEILFIQNLDPESDRGIIQFAETLAKILNIEFPE